MMRSHFRLATSNYEMARYFGVVSRRFNSNKFQFYDLIKKSNRHPSHSASPTSATGSQNTTNGQNGENGGKNVFSGNYSIDKASAEERIRKVFGGRIAGEDRQSSSRRQIGKPRLIAGVKVPDKPKEPDNCCMSGCINCVWEIYNDDVKEWNTQRKKAAKRLVNRGGVWPTDFHPPVQYLNKENLPESMAKQTDPPSSESAEGWDSVPVQIRAFAEMEKKLKSRRKPQSKSTVQ